MENKKIYLAGDMLTKGAQLQRKFEAEELRKIGYTLHVPHEDKSINDKANVDNENLAERIVKNDTRGLIESEIVIVDAHENGKGTLVELGQLAGMKDLSLYIYSVIESLKVLDIPAEAILEKVEQETIKFYNKKIYVHNTDIRRANTAHQQGDRREYGPNQYVYGTALKLTAGKGFYEWEEIIQDLSKGDVTR